MSLTKQWWATWVTALGLPLVVFLSLLAVPAWDKSLGTSSFHFYVVSATAIAAAVACLFIIGVTESLRETRLLFLGLAFLSIAAIFAVHGLGTPGHIHDKSYATVPVSSWFSVTMGAIFITASVMNLPDRVEVWLQRYGGLVFGLVTLALGLYIGLSLVEDEWLEWVPIASRPLQLAVAAFNVALLSFAAWRYFQAFLFARLPWPASSSSV